MTDGSGLSRDAVSISRETQPRLASLFDYLRDLHALRTPPIRDIASYGELRLDSTRVSADVAGVRIDPNGPAWLIADLVDLPPEPVPPDDVSAGLVPRLVPAARPLLRSELDLDPSALDALHERFGAWMAEVWEPWHEAYQRCGTGRRLYLDLFDAYERLQADRDILELTWGFGRLQWASVEGKIDHPIVVVPMEIVHDAASARLSIVPAGPAQVRTDFLNGVPLVARRQLNAACESLESDPEADPWRDGFCDETLAPLVKMMSNDGFLQGGPRLTDEWVVYIRRRPSGYLDFVRSLDENLAALAALPPLAALVADDPHSVESDEALRSPPPKPLLPLPANDEQRKILRFATTAAGVTVEGPPGTGKSHTIRNLICNFIAQGQRVLVSAEKEQALSLLVDGLPDEIQPLCVPVLGSGQAERLRLERSIDAISQARFGISKYDAAAIARLERDLDRVHRDQAAGLNELRRQHAVEASSLPAELRVLGGTTLSDLGSWLAEREDALSYIPDDIGLDVACPLRPDEVDRLASLLGRIDLDDLNEAVKHLPDPAVLPSASELSTLHHQARDMRAESTGRGRVTGPLPATPVGIEVLRQLAGDLEDAATRSSRWDEGWQGDVNRSVLDPASLALWESFVTKLAEQRTRILSLRSAVQLHRVELPTDRPLDQPTVETLTLAAERVRAKGRLGLAHRAAHRILGACRVDGHPPASEADIRLLLAESHLRTSRRLLVNLLESERDALALQPEMGLRPEEKAQSIERELEDVLAWHRSGCAELAERCNNAGITPPTPSADVDVLAGIAREAEARVRVLMAAEIDAQLDRLVQYLAEHPRRNASPLWERLADALTATNWQGWHAALIELGRLTGLWDDAREADDLIGRLAAVAPAWARAVRESRGSALGPGATLHDAWHWRQSATWFSVATGGRDVEEVEAELRALTKKELRLTADLAAAKAWTSVIKRIDGPTRAALSSYKQASAQLGKSSKFAPLYQRQVRDALVACRHAVPVWIMPVERVLTEFRCEPTPPFDVLIVDEASQISMTRLPIVGLARKVIVVGDDKQISPSNPGMELQPTFDSLAERLAGVPRADVTFHVNASLYDLALTQFPRKVQLTEHFRCLTDIISFSNDRYYGGNLVPLRDQLPSPSWAPTNAILVENGFRDDDNCNRPEAEYAAALVSALVKRPEYAERSFGVISLHGKAQSRLIHDLIFDRLGSAGMAKHRLRVGEPAVLQGDERDVVIISTVVSDAGGRRIAAMTRREHRRMINVAASRAKDQLWVLHSVPADAFPRGDERAALIRHCSSPLDAEDAFERLEELVDQRSPFERDVLKALVDRGYRTIRPQYKVGRYRIDFVVEGPNAKLAVECDGDRFHGPDEWLADRSRQDVLERAGWTFVRIRGSSFYRDRESALRTLWDKLDELGIPTGDWRSGASARKPLDIELDLSFPRSDSSTPVSSPPRVHRTSSEHPRQSNRREGVASVHSDARSAERYEVARGDSAEAPDTSPAAATGASEAVHERVAETRITDSWASAFEAADAATRATMAESTTRPDDPEI